MRSKLAPALALGAAVMSVVPALAQSPEIPLQGRARDPALPPLDQTIPEKVRPGGAPATTGSTLSDKLQSSDGVLRPNSGAVPDNTVTPPVPNPNSTPVIRPGELPGNGPNTQAK